MKAKLIRKAYTNKAERKERKKEKEKRKKERRKERKKERKKEKERKRKAEQLVILTDTLVSLSEKCPFPARGMVSRACAGFQSRPAFPWPQLYTVDR